MNCGKQPPGTLLGLFAVLNVESLSNQVKKKYKLKAQSATGRKCAFETQTGRGGGGRLLGCCREGRSNAHIKGDYQRIGDVMLKNFQGLKVRLGTPAPLHPCKPPRLTHILCAASPLLTRLRPQPLTTSLHKQSEVLLELEKACRSSRRLEALCRDFELQKVCYIPLNVFVLRPLHRLVHYKQILERLCKHYPATHVDFRDCRGRVFKTSV